MKHRMLTILALLALPVFAQEQATVKAVTDGDTIRLEMRDGTITKSRLTCIDSPEISQQYGPESKDALEKKILGKQVIVYRQGTDKYGRLLAEVFLAGEDINRWTIEQGHSWVYPQYCSNSFYVKTESAAKEKKLGLWAFPNPVAPWVYRHSASPPAATMQAKQSPESAEGPGELTPIDKVPPGQSGIVKVGDKEVWNSSGSANGSEIHTGPRGGKYYINSNGNKTYVRKK